MADRAADYGSPVRNEGTKAKYDQLKQQVRDIKNEHKQVQQASACNREARSLAISDICQGYEEQLDDERRAKAALQQRLQEALARSAKMRQQAEREQCNLQAQIAKLQAAAEADRATAEARAEEEEARRAREAAEWEARLEAEREVQELAKQQLDESRLAFIKEVEEWSQGEVEAIQSLADERVQQEQGKAQALKQRVQEMQQQLATKQEEVQHLSQQLTDFKSRCNQLQEAARQLQAQLKQVEGEQARAVQQAEEEGEAWRMRLERERREHGAEMKALKQQHAAEIDQVHSKLQTVLQRKDTRLAAVTAQLRAAEERQRQTEEVLECQRRALLGMVDAGEEEGDAVRGSS